METNVANILRTSILSLKKIGEYVKRIGSFSDSGETVANKLENVENKIGEAASGSTNDTLFKAIENIKFDTSNVAKQGDNQDISLTTINDKLGNLVMSTREEQLSSLEYIDSQLN